MSAFLLSACAMVPVGETNMQKASKINVQLGIGYYQRNNLEQANAKLVKALRQDPKSSQAHHAYAVLLNRLQEKEKAEQHFKKAIELDPENSEALTNYGSFLCRERKYLDAEKMFCRLSKTRSIARPKSPIPTPRFVCASSKRMIMR